MQQLIFNGAYQTQDPTKRAAELVQFAQMFPDSPYADQAMGVAAASYRQTQNTAKMIEVANGLLAKDPNNVGMLLLLADYYSEKGEQLDKAEADAKKATAVLADAKKPEGVTDEQWQQQVSLQKGLALSALGQVNIQKKTNAAAVENLKQASPLLKVGCGQLRAESIPAGVRAAESEEGGGREAGVHGSGVGGESVQAAVAGQAEGDGGGGPRLAPNPERPVDWRWRNRFRIIGDSECIQWFACGQDAGGEDR